MNKIKFLIIVFLFAALCANVFGQNKSYPFDIHKSGQGKQSVIFIPGFACSGAVWDETRSKFEKYLTCYTLTMPGFAGTKPQSNASFKNWENEIANFIKEQKLEKPIVVGHSMGGGLALVLAADFPDLMEKIVVVDALPCLAALMNPAFQSKEKPDCTAMTEQMLALSDAQFYQMQKRSIPQLLADTSKQELVISWTIKSDRKTFAEMYCDFSNTDLRASLKNIKCPALILLESTFKSMKPSIEDQYKNLKNADLQYADKGLHFIMYDDKEWYFKQLITFIK